MVHTVSHSEAEAWLLCERRHYYGYALGIQRVETSEALARGTLGHSVWEEYFTRIKGGHPQNIAAKNAMEFLRDQMDGRNSALVDEIAKLFGFFVQADLFRGWDILAVEKEFVCQITDDLALPFVVDAVMRDKERKTCVVDWKFTYDFYSQRHVSMMPQIPKYIGALRLEGFKVDYGLYGMMRTRKLSAANNVAANKIQTIQFVPTDTRINRTLFEQRTVSEEILERKALPLHEQSLKAKRVSNKLICNSCSFLSICTAELDGTNAALVLKTEYRARERREFIVPEEDD